MTRDVFLALNWIVALCVGLLIGSGMSSTAQEQPASPAKPAVVAPSSAPGPIVGTLTWDHDGVDTDGYRIYRRRILDWAMTAADSSGKELLFEPGLWVVVVEAHGPNGSSFSQPHAFTAERQEKFSEVEAPDLSKPKVK